MSIEGPERNINQHRCTGLETLGRGGHESARIAPKARKSILVIHSLQKDLSRKRMSYSIKECQKLYR